uniref:F-box protein AT5G49610-like beta-propeller domain-containing protein n=1 Tax=Aegilops tauschii subsp. strangulata TaxID=200361 RepID=A0A453NF27_AEGTS
AIEGCCDGNVLLQNFSLEQLAVYNPLTRALDLIPVPPDKIFEGARGDAKYLGCYILSSEEGGEPLRLVYTCHDKSRARAAIFSSESREWQIFPWSEAVTPLPEDEHWLKVGTMVNGFVYWIHTNEAYILVLNTATLHFSQMDLPPTLVARDLIFRVGETKDDS